MPKATPPSIEEPAQPVAGNDPGGDFVAIVSHELRTPLVASKGFLSMVLAGDAGELNEQQQRYLSRVYQANERMVELVDNLLDVASLDAGRLRLSVKPTSLESVVTDVTTELAAAATARRITIEVRRRQRLPLVLADESRLRQILLNLVDNAIKYSGVGTQVELSFRQRDNELITTVSDHGPGITAVQQKQLFTKFGRLYHPLSLEARGTGLGLYIVKQLVESQGGRIWVANAAEQGSRFSVALPIANQLPLIEQLP